MVTSHTEALNELYGPLDHFCVSHTGSNPESSTEAAALHRVSNTLEKTLMKRVGEKLNENKTKKQQPVAFLTCVEERVINTNTA